MMLSPQAARMGAILRRMGPLTTGRSKKKLPEVAWQPTRGYVASTTMSGLPLSPSVRSLSTQAATCDGVSDEEELSHYSSPPPPLASHRHVDSPTSVVTSLSSSTVNRHSSVRNESLAPPTAVSAASVVEAWAANLGRGNDDAWLNGPRSEDWYTGVPPTQLCPGIDNNNNIDDAPASTKIRSLPLPHLGRVTRNAVQQYFDNSWTLYETLFAGLKGEEGFYRPPVHGLRHPQIFYYGHTACLYVNKLRVSGVLTKPVNAYFESIFEVGVDEMLWDDMYKNDMIWPSVAEVHEYRRQVYEAVSNAIQHHPSLDDGNGPVAVNQSHPMWALFMGFEHERIHLETSSVLFRETPIHLVQTPHHWPELHPSARRTNMPSSHPIEGVHYPSNQMIAVNASQPMTVDLGKPANFPSYGWDNEYGERSVDVPPFYASEHMVTNGEYYQFVASGGYVDPVHWCDDGWAWRKHRNIKWPCFWDADGPAGSHMYNLRTIFEVINMPWDWPVDVNYYEAKAYCRWKTARDGSPTSRPYRILTEAEHHIIRHTEHNLEAARRDPSADKVMVSSGQDFPHGPTGANINLAYGSQNPVDYFAPSQSGHRDTTGSAWEWTEDHFNPLKGFEHHPFYDDFSTPCFDGKHSMIVGGSFASTGDEASVFARFHFRPHFLQHSGFRLVASDHDAPATHLYAHFEGQAAARDAALKASSVRPPSASRQGSKTADDNDKEEVYESQDSLHMYLGLHYPTSGGDEGVPPLLPHEGSPDHAVRFPQRVARLLRSLNPVRTNGRALDVGCAVGGASFELARSFERVDAFDFSQSFVNAARRMQAQEDVRFRIPVEAELFEEVRAVHEEGVTPDVLNKVNFFTGDACRLSDMQNVGLLSTYDGVVMSNLLCRLPDPLACLAGLPKLVNDGGVVVLVTPFSWLTEFTPRSKWLGGFYDPVTEDPIRSKDVLREIMGQHGFDHIHEEQMPLLIREHQRKYQYIVSEATGWRKVAA